VHGTVAGILDLLNQGGLASTAFAKGLCRCKPASKKNPGVMWTRQVPRRCLRMRAALQPDLLLSGQHLGRQAAGCAGIDEVLCTGCGVCAALCPQGAIAAEHRRRSIALMHDPLNIIISGVGGQGNILASDLLSRAFCGRAGT
jgi:ferredoxin